MLEHWGGAAGDSGTRRPFHTRTEGSALTLWNHWAQVRDPGAEKTAEVPLPAPQRKKRLKTLLESFHFDLCGCGAEGVSRGEVVTLLVDEAAIDLSSTTLRYVADLLRDIAGG